MLLSLTTEGPSARDLGFLLMKHPDRTQSFPLSFGKAHVFWPEAGDERATCCLLLDVDPVGLVRKRGARGPAFPLAQYVNDRPYAASSFLSTAIAEVFGSALNGRSRDRPDLAAVPRPLVARIPVLPARGGEELVRRLFTPLGYAVETTRLPLDPAFPEWGESPYLDLTLSATTTVAALLGHLYVLVPVLDDEKHYWVGPAELEKLVKRGEGWLAAHPERELVAKRYLARQERLARAALARLAPPVEVAVDLDEVAEEQAAEEEAVERPIRLWERRQAAVVDALAARGVRRVLDLGCGEGRLLAALRGRPEFEEIVGVDVSPLSLERAERRLKLHRALRRDRERIRLLHGSLVYRDDRLAGFDGAACVEVIEHLDPERLAAFSRVLFECARPATVVLTTPNREYNVRFEDLPAGRFRHRDHRFEWTRAEFREWAVAVASRHGYAVEFAPVGDEDPGVGPPTQMGVFVR